MMQCCSAIRQDSVASSRSLRLWTFLRTDDPTLSMGKRAVQISIHSIDFAFMLLASFHELVFHHVE